MGGCVRACMCVCVCARACACVCARVHVHVCVRARVRLCWGVTCRARARAICCTTGLPHAVQCGTTPTHVLSAQRIGLYGGYRPSLH